MSDAFSDDSFESLTRVGCSGSGSGDGVRGAEERLAAGSRLGNYRVLACLGEGGMGQVYEVEHVVLLQRFALKLLHGNLAAGAAGRERFVREARVMASLHHPGIVRVDDFGETDGRVWLRMELADGVEIAPLRRARTLGELLASCGGRLSPAVARDALTQILDALAVAHAAGLVHRDLKPANILLDARGRMKIADFGLVQMLGDEWLRSRVSETVARSMTLGSAPTRIGSGSGSLGSNERALMGTWDFMSPEQKAGGVVDARSDLYAVGLIAFRMLTGESVLAMEMPSEIVDGLDPAWDGWVRQAVASRPEKRFSSAAGMVASLPPLADAVVGEPLPVNPVMTPAEPVVAAPAKEPPPLPNASDVEPPSIPVAVQTPEPEPPPLPQTLPFAANEPGAAGEIADVLAAFDRATMRLVPACLWSIPCPWVGLMLRGRPILGGLFGLVLPIASVFAAVAGELGPELLFGAQAVGVLVALGVLIVDGRGGPIAPLSRAAALARARSLANHGITAAAIAGVCALVALMGASVGVIGLVGRGPPFRSDETMATVAVAVSFVLLLWFSIRCWRIYRVMSMLPSGGGSAGPPGTSPRKR